MHAQQLNRASSIALVVLSITALLTVMTGYLPGHPPQQDEGTAAHVFQLSVVAIVPAIVLFFATADWTQPLRNVRRLALPGAALALAFGALYYLEHYYYAAHYR
jgi:hypothetical protein